MEMTCFNVASFLAKTLNKPDEELAELLYEKSEQGEITLKDDAEVVALGLMQDKIKGLKDDFKLKESEGTDRAYKKGFEEAASKLENELRDKYSLESGSKGIDLIDELVDRFKSSDSKLTPDKVKLHETYIEREKQLKKEAKDQEKIFQEQIDGMKASFEKEKVWSVIYKDIRKKLMEAKPVLSKNERAAENQIDLFINSFGEDYEWQLADDGSHIPIKDGKRAEDNLGNVVKYDQLITGRIPDFFDLHVQDQKGGAGNEGGDTVHTDVPQSFESDEAYNKYINSTTDPEKREQAYMNYKAK